MSSNSNIGVKPEGFNAWKNRVQRQSAQGSSPASITGTATANTMINDLAMVNLSDFPQLGATVSVPSQVVPAGINRGASRCSTSQTIAPKVSRNTQSRNAQRRNQRASSKAQNIEKPKNVQMGGLTEFTLFPTLPAELRLKIWGFAMNEPRLIEIEYGPNRDNEDGSGLSMGNHQWTRVCPRSTRPPTVLQVCQEGREEGQKYYHQRTFETKADNSKERYIYYNPDADIIYFGDNTCISTIIRLPCQAKSDGIPRVAINNTGKILMCCDWDDSDSGTVMGYGFDGGISPLQALHGIDKDVAEGNDWAWPGYAGLKEVYFVVKSNLWPLEAGQIDASVCFRPARTDGITKGQIKFKEKILEALKDVNQTGGPERVGEKKWIGKDKPKFSFVSLSPPSVDEKIHDAIAVNSKDVRKLNARGWAFMKELEKSTGCIAQVPDQNYPGEPFREIGFFGTKQGVEKARALVEEKLAAGKSGNGGNSQPW